MRLTLLLLLLFTLVYATGYFYYTAPQPCPVPVAYRIGELDPRFELSREAALAAIVDAEAVWETDALFSASGIPQEELFVYDPEGPFVINFVFDERQSRANRELSLTDKLGNAEDALDVVREEYEALQNEVNKKRDAFERANASFNSLVVAYEAEIAQWNAQGGAPAEVFESLEERRVSLDAEKLSLEAAQQELNALIDTLNALAEQVNGAVEVYNRGVATFNEHFNTGERFTQGNYTGDAINIFTFKDHSELVHVLAHELGHALKIDHVAGEHSVMHELLGEQRAELSPEDVAAFKAVCVDERGKSALERVGESVHGAYERVIE